MTKAKPNPLAERIADGYANALERHATGCAPCLADQYLFALGKLPEKDAQLLLTDWLRDGSQPMRQQIAACIAGRQA